MIYSILAILSFAQPNLISIKITDTAFIILPAYPSVLFSISTYNFDTLRKDDVVFFRINSIAKDSYLFTL